MQKEQDEFIGFPTIVVRLLNGALKGCEYQLSAGKTLFIIAAEDALASDTFPSFPEDSVFIPAEGDGINFEIVVPSVAGQAVLLRELHDNATQEVKLETQQPYQIGSLTLAIRSDDENWSEDILDYQPNQVASPPPVRKNRRNGWLIAVIICTVAATAGLMIGMNKQDGQQREITALANRLTNEPKKYQILSGRDGLMYVLANDDRAAAWGRQSLVRLKSAQEVIIVSYQEERQRVERWIGQNYPLLRLHHFKLDQPANPVFVMSQQRNSFSEQEQHALREDLLKLVPYALDIRFEDIDDQAVAAEAEEGIKKLAVPYTRLNHANSVTFVITGSVNDGERQRIRNFIEDYDSRWNGKYVEFAMELKDDWLKGKSFKYGHHGYVKITPGHWYFPKP